MKKAYALLLILILLTGCQEEEKTDSIPNKEKVSKHTSKKITNDNDSSTEVENPIFLSLENEDMSFKVNYNGYLFDGFDKMKIQSKLENVNDYKSLVSNHCTEQLNHEIIWSLYDETKKVIPKKEETNFVCSSEKMTLNSDEVLVRKTRFKNQLQNESNQKKEYLEDGLYKMSSRYEQNKITTLWTLKGKEIKLIPTYEIRAGYFFYTISLNQIAIKSDEELIINVKVRKNDNVIKNKEKIKLQEKECSQQIEIQSRRNMTSSETNCQNKNELVIDENFKINKTQHIDAREHEKGINYLEINSFQNKIKVPYIIY